MFSFAVPMQFRKLFLLTCLFFSFFVHSQSKVGNGDGILIGKIIDKKTEKPLEYVSVKLLLSRDSALLTGVYTDPEGKFNLENLPFGSFLLKISLTGFEPQFISPVTFSATTKLFNAGTIKLNPDKEIALEGVKVIGKSDVLTAGIDKKIYNVAEDLTVKGGTANDILNRLPSVEVDQDGNVMLRGEGMVTILIDGRPSSLSGGNGKTLLDALPAGSVERIEIVTNPSAKYNPDGTSGIINIVLKKNKLKGLNGSVSVNLGSGDLRGGNVAEGNTSLSYRNGWVNVYGIYNFRYLDGYRNNTSFIRQSFDSGSNLIVDQNRTGTDLNFGNTFRMGADFYLKRRNTLAFSATGNVGRRDRTGDLWSNVYTEPTTYTDLWRRMSYDPTQQRNYDVNLNFRHDLKDDRGNYVFDFSQSFGNESIQGYYQNIYYKPDSSLNDKKDLNQQLFNKEKNNISNLQFDFTYLFPKINARMETGTKAIIAQQAVNPISETQDSITNQWLEDTLANFNYRYDEQIYSVYGIFGQQIGKLKYQGGIRLEQAYQIPNLLTDTLRIVNDYFNFFPSAHIRYSLAEKTEIGLSYSKRITRASSADMNPFTTYADPFNLRRGNPYLKPEYIDSYDFSFSMDRKKWSVLASAYYRNNKGVITRFKEFYENGTSAITFKNISETKTLGQELVVTYKPYTWWRNTFSWNGNYIWYITNLTELPNRKGYVMNFKYNAAIEFWKKTASVQLSVTYNGRRITVQGIAQRQGPIDLAFEKKFFHGKFSLGTRVTDIFNTQGFFFEVDRPGVYQESEFKWLTRRIFLTASYKFGKLEMSNKSRLPGSEGGGDM
jgi:outer membrane receptor protein involved in Fe transport